MDKLEFNRLAGLYMDTVYRVARAGSRNNADAEDITQNTFLKLLQRSKAFNDDDHARKWLIRVAVNESNQLWRRRKHEDCPASEEEPAISDDFTEKDIELMTVIAQLPPEYRQVLHLYYFEDYRTKEIAKLLKVSDDTVRARLSRARKTLKGLLNGDR